MKSPKAKKKSHSSKKTELDETKHDNIKEKSYVTKEIETSITLLESPESSVVLESLLFLSKYSDIQRNNLNFVQSHGLLPKLLALLDHNICILRVSLRLLSQLLAIGTAQLQLNEDRFDEKILKICKFYVSHKDLHVKEFSAIILEKYSALNKLKLLLSEPDLIKATLKAIKSPETEIILDCSLELLYKFIDIEEVRSGLHQEDNFKLNKFIELMAVSEKVFRVILAIFEKITYFNNDSLQNCVKECKVIEHVLGLIVDPKNMEHIPTCLNIVRHSMQNEITESSFIQSLEFLKFCQWTKTCSEEVMEICANIFLDLSKNDSIRQMLFDLSIEDVILSFLRSDDKKILNVIFDAISYMSKHKYCCEKIVTPVVVKKIVQVLSSVEDSDDPYNETALRLLFYLSRRDARTFHMIPAITGFNLFIKYLKSDKLAEHTYRNLLDIINMFVTNNQLQNYVLSPDLYNVILTQTASKFDEICMRSVEIMINCLNHEDFRDHFLLKGGPQIIIGKLANCRKEKTIKILTIFFHNAMMYENLSKELVHHKLLLVLRRIPDSVKYRNPLIERVMSLIYNMCLPIKFFENKRLELVDKISGRFYILAGPWNEPFPFLEILELRQMSTRTTIYVVDDCVKSGNELVCKQCYKINQQYRQSLGLNNVTSVPSISSLVLKEFINYGALSRDPYLPQYIEQIQQLVAAVSGIKKKIKILANFVDDCLCGPKENCTVPDKLHSFQLHIECIKEKLGTNMIPIGYLRLGFHCEKSLLFKTLADQVYIPATLVKGRNKLYWNEIALIQEEGKKTVLKMFVVDLMNNIGQLLPVGSRECNAYCDIQ